MAEMQNHHVTKEYFIKRIADLCLRSGLSGLPKDEIDQHILLKSVALGLGKPDQNFTELEINEKLCYWINRISQTNKIDHGSLRRWLVDAGYLERKKDGSCYQVPQTDPKPELFDHAINQIDVEASLKASRDEIERRKMAYLSKK